MASRTAVNSEKGLQSPVLSQANICNGMVYVSGNVGIDVKTMKFIEGTCADRTVGLAWFAIWERSRKGCQSILLTEYPSTARSAR